MGRPRRQNRGRAPTGSEGSVVIALIGAALVGAVRGTGRLLAVAVGIAVAMAANVTERLFDVSGIVRLLEDSESKRAA